MTPRGKETSPYAHCQRWMYIACGQPEPCPVKHDLLDAGGLAVVKREAIDAATKPLKAEIERLRAEVDRLRSLSGVS